MRKKKPIDSLDIEDLFDFHYEMDLYLHLRDTYIPVFPPVVDTEGSQIIKPELGYEFTWDYEGEFLVRVEDYACCGPIFELKSGYILAKNAREVATHPILKTLSIAPNDVLEGWSGVRRAHDLAGKDRNIYIQNVLYTVKKRRGYL